MMSDISREEVDAALASVEARIETCLANLEMTVKTGFAELRTEIQRLRCEMHKANANLIKWGVALALAVVGTAAGLQHLISS